jgi:hypothetical protein
VVIGYGVALFDHDRASGGQAQGGSQCVLELHPEHCCKVDDVGFVYLAQRV